MVQKITLALLSAILFLSLETCATIDSGSKYSYYEDAKVYEIASFQLWIASRDTINAEARYRGIKESLQGFWDPIRREMWCPEFKGSKKEKIAVLQICGEELFHAAGISVHDMKGKFIQ